MKKILKYLIYLYLISIFFNGLLTKIFINNKQLLSFKSMFPEAILILIILIALLEFILYGNFPYKKQKVLMFLTFYMSCIVVMNLYNISNKENLLYVIRDTYLPFISCLLLFGVKFEDYEKKNIINGIIKILVFQVIIGFILAIFQFKFGCEWTAKFYTGYIFYGTDPISNIKIWTSNGVLRVPSIAGNSVLFAFYNIISYFFIKNYNIKGKKILLIMAFMNIILSNNKTLIVVLIVEYFIQIIAYSSKKKKIMFIFILSIIGMAIIINMFKFINKDIFNSMRDRVYLWKQLFESNNILNIVIPINLFGIGAGIIGFNGIFDNSYLYFLYSYGVIGLISFIIFIINYIKISLIKNNRLMFSLFITILISGITTNLFQGRVFITPVLLILFLINDFEKIEKVQEV